MTDSRAALGSDRLPWLSDEPKARPAPRKASRSSLWGPAAAGLLLVVAGGSYWLGTRSADEQPRTADTSRTVVAPLPEARTLSPQQQVEIAPPKEVNPAPAPEVRSAPQRELQVERPPPIRRIVVENPEAPSSEAPGGSGSAGSSPMAEATAPPAAKPAASPDAKPLKAWPAWKSQGAKGRIVRIGAFASRQQAKLGWRRMVRAYPAVAHLKATVVGDRNSRGRHFYRFQIGTTSQAHSEVLCQRMEKIRFSCAVVGLPWDPDGVER
jgi:hypothetical protein